MNKSILYSVLAFIGGAAAGSLITWKVVDKVLDKKYSEISDREIASVKERYTIPKPVIKGKEFVESLKTKPEDVALKATSKPSLVDYAKKIKSYTNYSNKEQEEKTENIFDKAKKAYVIEPDEYGDDDEYDQQEITLYADGILADEDDTILNADEVLGEGNIEHMGEYEDDALHVKNEERKVYYEVLADVRSYEDATGKKPHLDKDEEDE